MHSDPYSVCQADVSDCDYLTVAYAASSGRQLWAERHAISGHEVEDIDGVASSPNGKTIYVSGSSGSPDHSVSDYVTIAYRAATGHQQWLGRYNNASDGSDSDVETAMSVSRDGSRLYLTGTFQTCEQTVPQVTSRCVSSYGTVTYRP